MPFMRGIEKNVCKFVNSFMFIASHCVLSRSISLSFLILHHYIHQFRHEEDLFMFVGGGSRHLFVGC